MILSKFAFEQLRTIFENNRNSLTQLHNFVFSKKNFKIKVSKSLKTEIYLNQSYLGGMYNVDRLENINSSYYITGMLRDNYNYLLKLEEILEKKKKNNPNEKVVDVDLPHKYPIEKSSSTFLGDCPDYNNKFLIDLARNYIARK